MVTGKYISAHSKDSFSTKRKTISLLNSIFSFDKGLSNQSISKKPLKIIMTFVSHNNEDENFKLSVTRFYGKDRMACEIAEAVILRSRTGDVCNLKSEWHQPPIVQVTRQVTRGL